MGTPRRSRSIELLGALGLVSVLVAGLFAYWRYVNIVPPYVPHLPPGPSPNGYLPAERAAMALQTTMSPSPLTPPVSGGPPAPPQTRWPDGPPAEVRARLDRIEPLLNKVRAQFRYEWSAAPDLPNPNSFPPFSGLRECARGFAAESILRRKEGDDAGAMPPALDALELAARSARGGSVIHWLVALAIHGIGLSQAERLTLQLPAGAIPASLTRVRRLRKEWPRLPEMIQAERVSTRVLLTERFTELGKQSPLQQWRSLSSDGDKTVTEILRLLVSPRHTALIAIDDFYRREAEESRKPVRQRRPVPQPTDAWSQYALGLDPLAMSDRLERPRTDLALLEVALAVRMRYLQHGRYPASLSEISQQWLPAIPIDHWNQPIAYRLKKGQPVIYSVGPDGKDDGGQRMDPIDLSPVSRGDLVFGHLTRHLKKH
jgi:hypothetical protein